MAKYCGKCGARLDEKTGLCPTCDAEKIIQQVDIPAESLKEVNKKPETSQQQDAPLSRKEARKKRKADKKAAKKDRKAQKKAAKKAKKKEKWTKLTFGQKVGKIFTKIIVVAICVAILTIGIAGVLVYFNIIDIPFITNIIDKFVKTTPQEAYATEIVRAFNNNDMPKINDIIFNSNSLNIDDNIGATFEDNETKQSNKGVISIIFAETHIALVRVENNRFVYEVEAPDMNGVFDNISSIQTQDELIKHIEKYAKDAKHKKSEVSVEFTEKDDSFIADYITEEFINAITGGLVDEYKGIFTQYMDEITSKG